MKTKVLMQDSGGKLIATSADPNGKTYLDYLNKGFKPIGEVRGFNVVVKGYKIKNKI